MILRIALKELYHNITTPRFITGFVLCLLLIPFSIVISINEYKSKINIYEIEKKKADEENLAKVYSMYRPVIVKKPAPLSIFARGISYRVGNRIKVLFGDKPMMTEGKAESRDNPFLNRFFTFDFVSVLIIIISLMAFLFTYDTCTGERESGTLKMMLSNAVSRSTILTGKLLGTLFTLLPILLFSFGLCLLVILLTPSIDFTLSEWIRIGMIFLFSMVFLILFMIIGLFVSSHLHHSGTSMVICLLIWVTFLFIVPSLANYSARSFVKVGSVENLNYDIAAIEHEFEENLSGYAQKLQKPDWGMINTYWADRDGFKLIGGATKSFMEIEKKKTEYSEPLRIQYADRKWQIRKVYLDKLKKQQKFARYCSFLSPAEVFKESVAGLCATNYEGHNEFLEQTRAYREALVNYYVQNKLFSSYLYFNWQDPDSYMTADEMIRFKTNGLCKSLDEFETKYQGDWKYLTVEIPNSNLWQWQPMDLSALPSFTYKPASVMNDVRDSLSYFGILLALAIVLYYLSFLSFTKYDVR
ncbi:MAG: ABC transporter permease subunit [Bacteroidales bacterium]|nr:ABC transporter permease subunit [Bacteroidales bacterium]